MNFQNSISASTYANSRAGTCRLCGSELTRTFVDLGMSPLCESYVSAEHIDSMEPFYPLHALVCDDCFLVQLKEYVTAEHIFSEYAYFSSYSTSWVDHAKAYCEMITSRLDLGADSLVVELASNDGYLLKHFQPLGVPVLGVEPAANIAKVAKDLGIETIVDFFGVRLADKMAAEGRMADVIVGNNVVAHVPDLNDFVAGMPRILKPEGLITLEFPHLERLMEENQFDTIYHEHFSYYSLVSMTRLAARHDLKVVDVEELPTHGGSLRAYLAHVGSQHRESPSVQSLLDREIAKGFLEPQTYSRYAEQVKNTKRRLLSMLIELKDAGKTICGYGAPGKGNTLLNYCGIGPDFLEFTVDRNPYKHGQFTPGMHIPIHPVEAIETARPDYILILPWNLKDEIMAQMRHVGDWGAKFIIPIPEATIVDPKDFVK